LTQLARKPAGVSGIAYGDDDATALESPLFEEDPS